MAYDRAGHASCLVLSPTAILKPVSRGRMQMGNIFYIIGVVVVVLAILGYLGLR